MMKNNVLIITGEPSGDMHGGELLAKLKNLLPEVSFWGIGGDRMEAEGAELIEHVRNLSIIGVWEIFKKLPTIHKQYKNIVRNVQERQPALAILIDYPGFNLKVAKFLQSQHIPVIYYIIPQVWAWGPWRIKALKRYVSKALVLFKFEETLLAQSGIDCQFVGHPLIDKAPSLKMRDKKDQFTIALLPGSRDSEALNIFPAMLDAAEKIRLNRPDIGFILAESSNVDESIYNVELANHKNLTISRQKDNTFGVLNNSDFAIITSGTATLEATLLKKPMIITYRTAFLTVLLARAFLQVSWVGLANIIANKEIIPELLQENATNEKIASKTLEIINDDSCMQEMKEELGKVSQTLGGKGASRRAAEAVKQYLEEKTIPKK